MYQSDTKHIIAEEDKTKIVNNQKGETDRIPVPNVRLCKYVPPELEAISSNFGVLGYITHKKHLDLELILGILNQGFEKKYNLLLPRP